jgi:hypothetical protein
VGSGPVWLCAFKMAAVTGWEGKEAGWSAIFGRAPGLVRLSACRPDLSVIKRVTSYIEDGRSVGYFSAITCVQRLRWHEQRENMQVAAVRRSFYLIDEICKNI